MHTLDYTRRLVPILMAAVVGGATGAGCSVEEQSPPSFTGPSEFALTAGRPTALFTLSSSTPALQENVVFDASATTDEGVPCLESCTYSWDFDGEATGSGRIVTYQFQQVRGYAVRLTVMDAEGLIGTRMENVTVTKRTLPTASFTFSPEEPGQFETVHFTAVKSEAFDGRTITSYQWNFGDDSTATGLTASHAFQSIGSGTSSRSQTYTVTLTVTDSGGLQSSTNQDIEVVSGVFADFTASDQPASLAVVFNAERSRGSSNGFGGRNPITKYIWHFGDSTSLVEETSPIVSHTYPAPTTPATTYAVTVTLTVVDSAGRRETTDKSVTVNSAN